MTAAEDLKHLLIPYLEENAKKKGKKYICPLCGSGSGNNGNGTPAFNIIPRTDETKWKCHACGESGDVIDLDRMRNGGDFKEAMERLQERYVIGSYVPKKPATRAEEPDPEPVDYTDFFLKANNQLSECDYLTGRGICKQLQNAFRIGYVPDWRHPGAPPNVPTSPRIIIPTSKYSYLARDTRQDLTDNQKHYSKQKVGKMHILNAEGLYRETDYCFIVEGEIDCLSVLQCGFNCIGLGTANVIESKLLPMCRERKPDLVLIFALDNDGAGRLWEQKITEFQKIGIRCISAAICGDCKDPNELLMKNPMQLTKNLQNAVEYALHEEAAPVLPEQPEQEQPEPAGIPTDYNADGTEELTIANLTAYLQAKKIWVRYNVITHTVEYDGFAGESQDHLKETAPALIYDELHFQLKKCSMDKIGQFLNVIATRNKCNPVLEKIRSVQWDGRSRIEEIYRIFGIDEADHLSRTILRKWLMQCICGLHNSMENPFSLDIVLIFQGAQGIGKTRFLEKLALNSRYFGEGRTFDPRNKDSQIECTSKWICELGEIGSTMKKDIDSLKAFLTNSTDEYRLPYGKAALRYARLTSFCGTTNDRQFLIDETGNRRFAPISLRPDVQIDYEMQVKPFDSLQLWAEVNHLVETAVANGSSYAACFRLNRGELADLNTRNAEHQKLLKGEAEVIDILAEESMEEAGYIIEQEYMTVVAFMELHPALRRYSSAQIGKVLEKLGYPFTRRRINGSAVPLKVRKLPHKIRRNYNQNNY